MSATCEIAAAVRAPSQGRFVGRATNKSAASHVMRRRTHELRRLCAIRDAVAQAERAGLTMNERLIHQLVLLGQEFGELATDFRFVQGKWSPWSRELQADLDRWMGERFIESVPQAAGVAPQLRLTRLSRLVDSSQGVEEPLLPEDWVMAMADRSRKERDLLTSAVLAKCHGLRNQQALTRLLSLFGEPECKAVAQALDDADALITQDRATNKHTLASA